MKTIDIGDVPAIVAGNVINYTSGSFRYCVRFPAKPAVCTMQRQKNGRSEIVFGSYRGAVLRIIARDSIIDAIFEKAGGQPAS